MKWKHVGWGKRRIDYLSTGGHTAYVHQDRETEVFWFYVSGDPLERKAPNREYARMWAKQRLLDPKRTIL